MDKRIATVRSSGRRDGLTLLEVLIVAGLLVLLAGIFAFGTRHVTDARRRATANQQLALVAAAIEEYARFWPAWKVGGTVVAEKGWPDFIPGRLFAAPLYVVGDDVDGQPFNGDVTFALEGPGSGITYATQTGEMLVGPGDVLNGNDTLVYGLTAKTGTGLHLKELEEGLLVAVPTALGRQAQYPPYNTSPPTPVGNRQRLVDPWGTPLRYFWVYRDIRRAAHRGYLPVDYGAFRPGNANDGGVDNDAFYQEPSGTRVPKTAAGFVLESAGPDRKFGNVWKVNPSELEIRFAEDNLVISP